ncbi:MAG: glycosyltransferase family 4 protein [Bernardetiaceae bacterium]|nr:glycosyltransferase family 4 protein [Bernardetiaceae bacterium]
MLESAGHSYQVLSFLDLPTHKILYKPGNLFSKLLGVIKGYIKRILHFFKALGADYIFVYREITPLGPPIFEFLLTQIFNKKLIYDFDDAIWIPATSSQNKIAAWLKSPQKVGKICRWAHKVSVGNAYLAAQAQRFIAKSPQSQAQVCLNPTTIDTEKMHNQLKNHSEKPLTIGWTGSHSTLPYVDYLLPVIKKLSADFDFRFRIICNEAPNFELDNLDFVPWQKATEIEDLAALHIGIMPLAADAWAEGKCGFKALQYMALGIPAIVSPVGVNRDIVREGIDGFHATRLEEWEQRLRILLEAEDLRIKMGNQARKRVLQHFSVVSNQKNFLSLFD